MLSSNRRYDIDWVRVIAIGLLLVYHVAIGFQSWGIMIGFITNEKPWGSLWIPMMMLNVWRIPLLFFVSGMGVYFAMQNRNLKALLLERTWRILVPFVFGIFCIVPIHLYIWKSYYAMGAGYTADPGHLWFLGNIFVYVVVLGPFLFYLKRNENGLMVRAIQKVFSTPAGLLPVVAAFVAEVMILDPRPYELYAMTWHGFFLGLLAFFFGFCFVLSGAPFWNMLLKWRWLFLGSAATLFTLRLMQFQQAPGYWLATESVMWIVSVLAFGFRYLNHSSRALRYLSQAAYPVYIIHMIFLYVGSWLIFPLAIAVPVKFILVLLFTAAGCLGFYELVIRRVSMVGALFGLKYTGRCILLKHNLSQYKDP